MSVFFYDFIDIIFYGYLDILEIISDLRSDPFTLIDLELPGNSYMIECTNTQSFEEFRENCASTISVEQNFGYDMILFGYDLILIGSSFKSQ